MIRLIGILTGLFFALMAVWGFGTGLATVISDGQLKEATAEHEFHLHPRDAELASDGAFGKWDLAQLQRGMQVYKEVCAACHGLKFVAFRDLTALGYSEAEVKAIAAGFQVPGIDPNTGEANTRPGLPTDYFPSPYPNSVAAAAANNNAIPPDLSLMTKARHDGGNYVYSLLTGYRNVDTFSIDGKKVKEEFPEFSTPPNTHFNPYFANLNIAMAAPLTTEGQVTYAEGQPKATVDQMSRDVAAFLTWTAEPKKVKRTQVGWPVMGFLLFATILAWMAKNQVWAAIKPKKKPA
ncbi:Cytochrome b/c1 [Tsuneonella dongtanensis]|uniref:Cytochrome c1 n=1 Tax=Tsuneonella dongtanensis TaxID=692370 RepID=A0A1B2AAD5_9SPHN|nr:cytochrome c1 [Tsuneonella dongtanensis]ANY19143.1 Cytochrome b/c1 [Tsuneonella dongtanensis]